MRRATILLAAVAVMAFVAGGIALAKDLSCARQDGRVCRGTDKADAITGTNRADTIKARGGDDQVAARGGKDRVSGGDGGDFLEGGGGNDTLNAGANLSNALEGVAGGTGDDTLVESPGPDRFLFGPGWGQDRITGDGDPLPAHDNDDVCFACGIGAFTNGVTVDLAAGIATEGTNRVSWTPGIVEFATGSAAGDTIKGSSLSNVVNGFTGADNIDVAGDGGNDFINCGGDAVTDTVRKDAGDSIQGTSCDGDTIINVP